MSNFIKTGVIGHPIDHSKSPIIHNYWIEKHGLEGSYEAIDIAPDNLAETLSKLLREDGYAGFNVTAPHKEAVLEICDEIDDVAEAIGAVNTIWIEDGKIKGTNTDAFGFIENIKQTHPDFDIAPGPAIILGAGGAAKAVAYALLEEDVTDIRVINRTPEKAQAIAELDPRISAEHWDGRDFAMYSASLVVNTTTLGMEGQPPLLLDLHEVLEDALVCDLVYAPPMTNLLLVAQEEGKFIVPGLGMLLHQARPAFEKWYGILPDITNELQKKVLA